MLKRPGNSHRTLLFCSALSAGGAFIWATTWAAGTLAGEPPRIHFERGEFREAVLGFEAQRKAGSLPPEDLIPFGEALVRLSRFDEATEVLTEALGRDPEEASAWYVLALCRFARLDFEAAIQSVERSLSLAPEQPEALKLLGRIHVARGASAEAEQVFADIIRKWPGEAQAHYLLGRLYQSIGRLEEASHYLARCLDLQPENPRAHAYLGSVRFGLGESAAAEQQFRESLRLNGEAANPDWVPYLEYGVFLQRLDRQRESLEALAQAVELAPREVEARFEFARALYRSGRLEEGRRQIEAAIELSPLEGRLHYLLSRICFESGDRPCGERHAPLAESEPEH